MRAKTMLLAVLIGTAGALLPASPASACITVYLPVIGSACKPCLQVPGDDICLR